MINFVGVKRSVEVPRIRVHFIVEIRGNKTKPVNFCLVKECDRYEARAWRDLCEADRVGFFELVSEDPLRKSLFAVQDEGSRFSVAKEPGENVVCHRHASRVGAVTSAGSSVVEGVKHLKVENVEGRFTNISNEKLGRFQITSRGEDPLLNDRPENLELAMGSDLCCVSLAKLFFLDEEKEVDSYIIHDGDYCNMRNCTIGAHFNGPHENPDDFSVRAVCERH